MSIEAVGQFREALNANEDWQEEVRNFGDGDNMVSYAKGKGHEFTDEEYNEFVEGHVNGELSEFEMELVAGGFSGKTGLASLRLNWLQEKQGPGLLGKNSQPMLAGGIFLSIT